MNSGPYTYMCYSDIGIIFIIQTNGSAGDKIEVLCL